MKAFRRKEVMPMDEIEDTREDSGLERDEAQGREEEAEGKGPSDPEVLLRGPESWFEKGQNPGIPVQWDG
jgi:hypothetical protein